MAHLAVDKDGTEWVWSYCPLRNKYRGVWDAPYNDDDYVYSIYRLEFDSEITMFCAFFTVSFTNLQIG